MTELLHPMRDPLWRDPLRCYLDASPILSNSLGKQTADNTTMIMKQQILMLMLATQIMVSSRLEKLKALAFFSMSDREMFTSSTAGTPGMPSTLLVLVQLLYCLLLYMYIYIHV